MRRNPTCEARDCACGCHTHAKGATHCHPGRRCSDVDCVCILATVDWSLAFPIADLFPFVSTYRGGIQYRRPDQT